MMSEMDGRIGSSISLQKTDLSQLLDRLQAAGYRVVGPRRSEDAIVYDQLTDVTQLPFGWVDEQDGGRYRLHQDPTAGYFDYAVGPHSLKPFLFPPRETLLQMDRNESGWTMSHPETDSGPLAVLGVRSCDLHALAIQDRIFLEGAYQDPGYRKRREQLFLVAIQCRRAAATCFCHSYQTGPRATKGFDLALTELEDSFVIEIGSQKGAMICDVLPNARHAEQNQQEEACQVSSRLLDHLERRDQEPSNPDLPRPRSMNTEGIRDLLMNNLEHPRWDEVAERCLACSNCTMVCPTCFCASVQEVADLTGDHVSRERHWDSCFTAEHSRVSSGVVRPTVRSRYRQWLTHKLASWIDQFGESGCVGCGRCITWCPVGIDLTEEVAAIRGTDT